MKRQNGFTIPDPLIWAIVAVAIFSFSYHADKVYKAEHARDSAPITVFTPVK